MLGEADKAVALDRAHCSLRKCSTPYPKAMHSWQGNLTSSNLERLLYLLLLIKRISIVLEHLVFSDLWCMQRISSSTRSRTLDVAMKINVYQQFSM